MTRAVVVAADGVVEEQFTYAFHRLREDGIAVEVATPTGEPVTGERGLLIEDTRNTGAESDPAFDLVILPAARGISAGLPPAMRAWLAERLADGSVFGCIGSSVRLLVWLDALDGRLVTGPDELAAAVERAGGRLTGDRVTVDGTIVTGRDTAALPFFMAALRNTLAIPQDPDSVVRHRPYQDRAAWEPSSSR